MSSLFVNNLLHLLLSTLDPFCCRAVVHSDHSSKFSVCCYINESENASGCSYTIELGVKQPVSAAVLSKNEAYLFHQMDVRQMAEKYKIKLSGQAVTYE